MDDIVTELRKRCAGQGRTRELMSGAVDEIQRLRKELHEARMQTALWRALCEEVQAELHDTVERTYRIEDARG